MSDRTAYATSSCAVPIKPRRKPDIGPGGPGKGDDCPGCGNPTGGCSFVSQRGLPNPLDPTIQNNKPVAQPLCVPI